MQTLNLFITTCCLVGCCSLFSQTIVNTETLLADPEEAGWFGSAGFGGDLSFGNSRVTDFSMDGSIVHAKGPMLYRIIGSWAKLAEDGVPIQQTRFVQARVNRMLGSKGFECFAFVQAASNNVLLMKDRLLMGGGVRKALLESERGWVDVAWGPFSEREVYDASIEEPAKELIRSSVTVATRWVITERVVFRNTVYIQSAFSDWSDTRFFFESAANVAVLENLSFEFDVVYRSDSQPHGGLAGKDVGTVFGLRWEWD